MTDPANIQLFIKSRFKEIEIVATKRDYVRRIIGILSSLNPDEIDTIIDFRNFEQQLQLNQQHQLNQQQQQLNQHQQNQQQQHQLQQQQQYQHQQQHHLNQISSEFPSFNKEPVGPVGFEPASEYMGSKSGYIFQMGPHGLGYYIDPSLVLF